MIDNAKGVKLWQLGLFTVAVFMMGLYVGILQGEKTSKYQIVSSGIPQSCWILNTQTGHLYLKGVNSSSEPSEYDFGEPDATCMTKMKLEVIDVDKMLKGDGNEADSELKDGRPALGDYPPNY
jgi:hypothetical protein